MVLVMCYITVHCVNCQIHLVWVVCRIYETPTKNNFDNGTNKHIGVQWIYVRISIIKTVHFYYLKAFNI